MSEAAPEDGGHGEESKTSAADRQDESCAWIVVCPGGRPSSARCMQEPLKLFVASRGREGTRTHLAELLGELPAAPHTGVSELRTIS